MLIESGEIKINDEILIIGSNSGVVNLKISNMLKDDAQTGIAQKGDMITFPCEEVVRVNDRVYIVNQVVPEPA